VVKIKERGTAGPYKITAPTEPFAIIPLPGKKFNGQRLGFSPIVGPIYLIDLQANPCSLTTRAAAASTLTGLFFSFGVA
jgi:hypothetical protein